MKILIKELENILLKKKYNFNEIVFLAGDASNRKYFQVISKKTKNVLMYDNTKEIGLNKFIVATKILKECGIKVPKIYNDYSQYGILIIENFGENKYGSILNTKNKIKLYKLAIDTLVFIHKNKKKHKIKSFDNNVLFKELNIFFEWFLPFNNKNISISQKKILVNLFSELFSHLQGLQKVLVHRDFHVDNLFYLKNEEGIKKCAWIDYQDMLLGPISYDLMSLLEDARKCLNNKVREELLNYYLENMNFKNDTLFRFSFKILALQRHLKVLGIFCRLNARDSMPTYLFHLPRIKDYLRDILNDKNFHEIGKILKPLIF